MAHSHGQSLVQPGALEWSGGMLSGWGMGAAVWAADEVVSKAVPMPVSPTAKNPPSMEKKRALPDMRGPLFCAEGAKEILERDALNPQVPVNIFNLVFARSIKNSSLRAILGKKKRCGRGG